MNDTVLELKKISLAYGQLCVVKNLSLSLEKGQIGCLLGASGCGKTTILRSIAGFEPLVNGSIELNGTVVSRQGITAPPAKRAIGMVFQDYALFPHLSLLDNVAFGLRGLERNEKINRVNEMLDLVGLDKSQNKFPHEVSGGQQQRVALARALAPKPDLLLMDEPFSNLDVVLRERLSAEVRDILKSYGATVLFVTHNQQEAFALADRIGVVQDGLLLQWDDAHTLYHCPKDRRVAAFVGEGVFLQGNVESPGTVSTGLGPLKGTPCTGTQNHGLVDVLIRPEDILHDDKSQIQAEVIYRNFRGANVFYKLRLANGDIVQALVPSHCDHKKGEYIGIRADVRHLVTFSKSSE